MSSPTDHPVKTLSSFTYHRRHFFITLEKSDSDGAESIQLNEVVNVKGKPLKHFMESDGSLVKTDPLVFAYKNEDAAEIQISMHYEGLPMEPLKRLFKVIESRWGG